MLYSNTLRYCFQSYAVEYFKIQDLISFDLLLTQVIGVDVSETQVACAPQDIPNCEFKVGYSDKLSFIESESVDLFCTGESFHYMPHKE